MSSVFQKLEGFRLPQPKPEDVHKVNMQYLDSMAIEDKIKYYLYLEMMYMLDENAVVLSPIQWSTKRLEDDPNPADTILAGHLAQLNSSLTEFEKNHPELY